MNDLNPRDLAEFWWEMYAATWAEEVPVKEHIEIHQIALQAQADYEHWFNIRDEECDDDFPF